MSRENERAEVGRGLNRREFMAAAGGLTSAAALKGQATVPAARPVVCLFSKPLGNRPFAELPGILKGLGVEAVDLTCRPGGHVVPERVADDLPQTVELLKSAGVSVPMITTDIADAAQGHAEAIVKTAAALGIRYAKMGYYRYDKSGRIERTLNEVKPRMRDVAALFKQYGVIAGYHNHSKFYVGAPLWDLWQLLRELPAEAIGSYFDMGHATVEGGESAWMVGLNLLLPRVVMVAVKDFAWAREKEWKPKWGPLGEGMVRWRAAFERLRAAKFAGPISLHVEYGNYGKTPGTPDDTETLANIRKDITFLRGQLSSAGLT